MLVQTYRAVIDQIFPVERPGRDTLYSITLRFLPAMAPESEITVNKSYDGSVHLAHHVLAEEWDSEQNLPYTAYGATAKFVQRDINNPNEIARLIPTRVRDVKLPPGRAEEFLSEFLQMRFVLPRPLSRFEVRLDPTEYEVWYLSGAEKFYFSFSRNDRPADLASAPLVQWATRIRKAVLRAEHGP